MRLKWYITEAKKKVSAAVLMTDGEKFLAIHPTGWKASRWEIPKGNIDDGETEKQAAVREFYEETGQKINISDLKRVGKFSLHSAKDVILFTYGTDNLPPIGSMKNLTSFGEKNLPEINSWKYIPFNNMKLLRPEMHDMVRKAIE